MKSPSPLWCLKNHHQSHVIREMGVVFQLRNINRHHHCPTILFKNLLRSPLIYHQNLSLMNLAIVVAEGLDRSNPGEETICDIRICAEITTLQQVHDSIVKVLSLEEADDLFYCFQRNTDSPLNFSSTFTELGAICDDSIILDARNNRKRKISCLKPSKENKLGKESGILELICTTRLLEADGNPFRKVRVVVQSHHNTSYLMQDISNLWGKSGLKFKCGRNVLSADKSYAELGVDSESEIVITGGRG